MNQAIRSVEDTALGVASRTNKRFFVADCGL